MNFDERDLMTFAEKAGFKEIHLDLKVEISPMNSQRWEVYIRSAGNPKVPTLEEAMTEALTPKEKDEFEAHLRPLVEAGEGIRRSAAAYLWTTKL